MHLSFLNATVEENAYEEIKLTGKKVKKAHQMFFHILITKQHI